MSFLLRTSAVSAMLISMATTASAQDYRANKSFGYEAESQ